MKDHREFLNPQALYTLKTQIKISLERNSIKIKWKTGFSVACLRLSHSAFNFQFQLFFNYQFFACKTPLFSLNPFSICIWKDFQLVLSCADLSRAIILYYILKQPFVFAIFPGNLRRQRAIGKY